MTQPPYQYGPPQQPQWGQPYPGMPPVPPKKKSPVVFIVIGLVVLTAAAGVLGTGLLWPGWMKSRSTTSSAPVDQSTPENAAKAVEDALNRRDIEQFVNVLVCKDGRTKAKNKDISLAEEILYRDIKPFDPKSKVEDVKPVFKVDEVRKIRPSDAVYNDENKDATVAIMSVEYPKDSGLDKQRGVLAMFEEDNKYVVCEMGFVPVSESQEPPPDPDPNSATGRMQAFAKAVNDKDIAAARRYMCATARAVNTWAEKAIADGGKLRLHDKVTTTKAEDSGQVRMWYTLNGAETKAGGFLKKESDGWCLFTFNNDAK
ncbi:hypothetical protein [Lentzea flava]|uniref:hypothetical protein n=1 Tax=Lentzea flava TaxID=103732 RepID=UPI001670A481|nr:hypothetical protein [Lentzea flava]